MWRIPLSLDGAKPLPRFTVLSAEETARVHASFGAVAYSLLRALVPGGHVSVASNPPLSTMAFHAFQRRAWRSRGEVIRLVQKLRGGDRPKGAEEDLPEVSMMPRAC